MEKAIIDWTKPTLCEQIISENKRFKILKLKGGQTDGSIAGKTNS
jgi:hypothetical protein